MTWRLLVLVPVVACKAGDAGQPSARAEPAATKPAELLVEPTIGNTGLPPAPALPEQLLGLPPREDPDHNPTTPAKVALGELLFFDARLSASHKTSCATCHDPERGYTEARARSFTDSGALNARHTPTLWNSGYATSWSWDGAMPMLEGHVLSHWRGQLGTSPDRVCDRLEAIPEYAAHFARAFAAPPTADAAAEALAAFVRTRMSGDSPWDQYEAGQRDAVSEEVIAGFEVFHEVAQCAQCHTPPLYSDGSFHALGVAGDGQDTGRMRVTGDPADRGAFRTPALRGLLHTAPYFHDGSAATLDEALDRKLALGIVTGNRAVDTRLGARRLSAVQRRQLMAFLRALSRPTVSAYRRPVLPKAPPPAPPPSELPSDAAGSDAPATVPERVSRRSGRPSQPKRDGSARTARAGWQRSRR